ncbi:VOC family protein [Streptomyces sp. NBC_01294]|uniref:VOC family protein n=1 Tax=Streptomyces sp. NBC_01294 TaxID=2903815 RepID=UPI002DDA9CE1|nr:VOC family protein [Streptomyces sp. NBC_01294]WRZ55195.1 hypothetical protein OG534_00955 [Streptomyces sp. NBC_01294]
MTEHTVPVEIPDRYRYAVVPHIMVDDAAAAIDFYQQAFGAREEFSSTPREAASCTPRSASDGRP